MNNIIVFGASGEIGKAFCQRFARDYPSATIHAVARNKQSFESSNIIQHYINFQDETAIATLVQTTSQDKPLDCVIVALGLLHDEQLGIFPEKSFHNFNMDTLHQVFEVNTFLPMLIAKYALPALNREQKSVFAVLSARVGSISDNLLGGWYAYRGAKAALNMAIKNLAIEMSRKNSHAIVVALHPGTVNSELSKPFQKNVPEHKLFSPDQSVEYLLQVIEYLKPEDSGKIWAWDGQEILP